jgi:hypothetical protein
MALPVAFSLLHSEFNDFLYAEVGEEGNGMPLSVVSALTRLDIDPWLEAARLSNLPKDLAAAALMALIARLPAGRWEPSDARGIAARLIDLLPERGRVARADPARPNQDKSARRPVAIWIVLLVIGAAAALSVAASGELPWNNTHASTSAPSAIESRR